MKEFIKNNLIITAAIVAIFCVVVIFSLGENFSPAKGATVSDKEEVNGSVSRTIDEFKYKGKTYSFVIYERGINMEVMELK